MLLDIANLPRMQLGGKNIIFYFIVEDSLATYPCRRPKHERKNYGLVVHHSYDTSNIYTAGRETQNFYFDGSKRFFPYHTEKT
jgi:hypothetical protein